MFCFLIFRRTATECVANLLTRSPGEVASKQQPKNDRPDDGNFTTGMENPITHEVRGIIPTRSVLVCMRCASFLAYQSNTHRRPLRRSSKHVIVWTVPLTWSESPLIIRPFAKFFFLPWCAIGLLAGQLCMYLFSSSKRVTRWQTAIFCAFSNFHARCDWKNEI